jgi:glycosyltransferase involved in cell wall biosynthesis
MTVPHTPRVSICIPTFNSAAYLGEALDSVLAQDFDDFEVVIVDDGSEDASRHSGSAYAARDRRIRCFTNRMNAGISGNCNRCMEWARGQYIKFLFADDILLSGRALSLMVGVLDAHPRVALVACGRRILDAQSRVVADKVSYPDGLQCAGAAVARHCMADLKNRIGEPTAVMFRRRDGRQGFDPAYCQLLDLEMWLRLLAEGDFHYLAEPLVGFRCHDGQATASNRKNLAYLADYRMLLNTYPVGSDAGAGWIGRILVRLQLCEHIWRLYAKKKLLTRSRAREELGRIMAPRRFFLLRPLYRRVFRKYIPPLYVKRLAPRTVVSGGL